mmetsp:Transcript_15493/g.15335  ORF Transcript_15493/g.15335 Transcript_15493/m.15335 type:complete len:117 (-) Transcript_15493:297-647(-)
MIEKTQRLSKPHSPRRMTLTRTGTESSGIFLSYRDRKSHTPASREDILNKIRKKLKGSSSSSINSKDGGIKGLRRKNSLEEEKFSESSSSSNYEEYNNVLRVTFKSDFLYQIGKVC